MKIQRLQVLSRQFSFKLYIVHLHFTEKKIRLIGNNFSEVFESDLKLIDTCKRHTVKPAKPVHLTVSIEGTGVVVNE